MIATEERFVTLKDGGDVLGVLHLPYKQGRPCPAVVYCPGVNGERYEVHRLAVKFARYLAERGIAFLRFDYFGMGVSDGHYFEMTNSTKISNVVTAFDYLKDVPEVDTDRTAFLGFSDGARVALAAALRRDVENVVFWSPILWEMQLNGKTTKRNRFLLHPKHKKVMKAWIGLWVGMEFFQDLQAMDVLGMLQSFTGNTMQVYGDDDPVVEETRNMLATHFPDMADHPAHRLLTVEKAGHLFTSVTLEQIIMEATYQWLKERLQTERKEG